jgi:hypothetical protein
VARSRVGDDVDVRLGQPAGALSAAAVDAFDPSLLLYPAYYCLVNGTLALLIGARRATTRAGG